MLSAKHRNVASFAKAGGFTLVEILVVVGIIAVLVAVLFPVVGRVRENGRSAVCQSNLKQIGTAIQLYTQDNNEHLPGAIGPGLASYLKTSQGEKLFLCPSFRGDGASYTYNTPQLWRFARHGRLEGKTLSEFPAASLLWVAKDVGWTDSKGNIYDEVPVTTQCATDESGVTRHNGGGNYAYLDGHVKWLMPQQYAVADCEPKLK